MATSIRLNVIQGGEVVSSQVVEGELVKIGRMASAHLRIDDPKVSRIHAMLEVASDGNVSVIDMGSAQGTLVDGKPISKVALSSGDRFVVGDTTVEVIIGAGGESAAPAQRAAADPEPRPAAPESARAETGAVPPAAAQPALPEAEPLTPPAATAGATAAQHAEPLSPQASRAGARPAPTPAEAPRPATHGALPLPEPFLGPGRSRSESSGATSPWTPAPSTMRA